MRIFRVSDDDGWEAIYGEKQIKNFAWERIDCSDLLPYVDEEATEDECQPLTQDERRVIEIDKNRDNMTVEDALFIVEYDNWYIEELEVE